MNIINENYGIFIIYYFYGYELLMIQKKEINIEYNNDNNEVESDFDDDIIIQLIIVLIYWKIKIQWKIILSQNKILMVYDYKKIMKNLK